MTHSGLSIPARSSCSVVLLSLDAGELRSLGDERPPLDALIESIQLQNFKSYVDARVPLGRFTLVIGANGCGKSNLFDALRFLHFIGSGSSIRDAIEGHALPGSSAASIAGIRGGSRELTHALSQSKIFRLEVAIRRGRTKVKYAISIDSESYTVVKESLSSSEHPGPYVFDSHPDTTPPDQQPDLPSIRVRFYKKARGTNPQREFSKHLSVLSQFRSRAAESNLNEDVARLVIEELSAISPVELRPEVLRQYASLGRFELGEHGENFAALVWQLKEESSPWWESEDEDGIDSDDVQKVDDASDRLAAIKSWLGELTPHPVSDVTTVPAPTGEVIFAVREDPFEDPLSARSLSDGTLRFAALAFAVLGSRERRTLVIEELENGVNPARMSLLVRMLESATLDTDLQILCSTHAPAVLDYASPDTLRQTVWIGWDPVSNSSKPMLLSAIPHLNEVIESTSIGELQTEGWFQHALEMDE